MIYTLVIVLLTRLFMRRYEVRCGILPEPLERAGTILDIVFTSVEEGLDSQCRRFVTHLINQGWLRSSEVQPKPPSPSPSPSTRGWTWW